MCVSIYFYPRRKLLNIAVFSLLSSLCRTSRIHLGTWFFPELDVLCLQGRTNLAVVALEAEGEQNSSKARYFIRPGAPEGCHLFLLLRILLAKLTAFFWPWLGHLDSGKSFFLFFWIISVSFLLTLLLFMFLFGESFSFFPFFFWGYETKETFGWREVFLKQKGSRVWGTKTELQIFFHLQSSVQPERKGCIPAPLKPMGNVPSISMGQEIHLRNPHSPFYSS